MTQCTGRLALIELPGTKTPTGFVRRPQDKKPILFSVPKACGAVASANGLCTACVERETKTATAVAKAGGKYVANQQTLLHGRFGGPIPPWSHMYGSRWFCETQAEKVLEVPEDVLRFLSAEAPSKSEPDAPVEMPPRKPKAVPTVGEPAAQEPTAQPETPKKRAPKKVVARAEPIAQTVTEPASAPAAASAPLTPAPKKFAPKKKAAAAPPTIGVVQSQSLGEIEVVKISVRKITIDDRTVYLSAEKDKVYDLKFKYIGRYNRRDDTIESKYPDSDKE